MPKSWRSLSPARSMKNNLIKLAVVIAGLGIFLILPVAKNSTNDKSLAEVKEAANNPSPVVEAKAALAENLKTGGILFEKKSKEVLPLASLTKIISALVVADQADLDEEVQISKKAISTPEPSSLRAGEHLRARDLLAMAMVESSNDAVAALAENFGDEEWFLNLMKNKAESLGASDMKFNNPIGLDVSGEVAGGYGSAEDLIKIASQTLDSPIWSLGSVRVVKSTEGFIHKLNPTNNLDSEITPLLGAKTGYTDLAGGNLLIITEYPIGNPIGIVVLGSTENGRFSDVKNILNWIKSKKAL